MNIEQIASNMLNGEPLHDAIVCGIVFTCFYEFYNIMFSSIFTIFKR